MTYWMRGFRRDNNSFCVKMTHWLDERISQSEEDRVARDGGDEGPSQKGKGIAMDSSTFSGDDEDGGNGGEEVSGDESDDSSNEEHRC